MMANVLTVMHLVGLQMTKKLVFKLLVQMFRKSMSQASAKTVKFSKEVKTTNKTVMVIYALILRNLLKMELVLSVHYTPGASIENTASQTNVLRLKN